MTLSSKYRFLLKGTLLSAITSFAVALTSCESAIFEDQGDCSFHYKLSFRYTKNILNADAFGSQVNEINVALYDSESGRMVYHKTETRQLTTENDYKMDIEILPGKYDIIAWCGGRSVIADASSFILDGQNTGDAITTSGAHIDLQGSGSDLYYNHDINRLYYGSLMGVDFVDSYGSVDISPVYLTKDTNHLTVQLQNINGEPIDPDQLIFELSARNSELTWDNTLADGSEFVYRPWVVQSTYSSSLMPDGESRATMDDDDIPNGVLAEFTTGRIMAGKEQRLTVRLKDTGETILSIPLVEYLLLVRNHYETATSNQDYLDRYDDFTMLFFIDETYTWIKSRIFINNWRVVPPQHEVL